MAVTRAAVFAAKGDRCLSCGAPATDVDHVVSAASGDDSLANFQPLCHSCHLEKTLSSPMPWDTSSGDAIARHERREATYWARVRAQPSLRACDDERTWPVGWRTAMSTRVAARAAGQLDTELRALLELIAGRLRAGRSLDLAAADAETLLHLSWPLVDHRHQMTGALATAAWGLRQNVSFYDGLYVALAVALGAPLVTADQRLSRAPGLNCVVERVGSA